MIPGWPWEVRRRWAWWQILKAMAFRRERRVIATPMRMVLCGAMTGMCLTQTVSLAAQTDVSTWFTPQSLYMLFGLVFSSGIAWQEVTQSRRRLTDLEVHAVRKDAIEPQLEQFREDFRDLKNQLAVLNQHLYHQGVHRG